MKSAGLITLADLPALKGKSPTTSQITVARLGKYSDPRWGKFEISEADYDGWKRNLSGTFGGRVSVDWDHSSDRGQGPRASAWITDLSLQGKDVIATVEWTPKGAKAVRTGADKFISPTYTAHYKDEQGVDRGQALLGAALTNRPVLRQLPVLSLSRDSFDGVATPRKRKKTMSKKSKTQVMVLDGGQLKPKKLTLKQMRKEGQRILARAPLELQGVRTGAAVSVDTAMTLAQFAPAGIAHAGTIQWDAPAAGASRRASTTRARPCTLWSRAGRGVPASTTSPRWRT